MTRKNLILLLFSLLTLNSCNKHEGPELRFCENYIQNYCQGDLVLLSRSPDRPPQIPADPQTPIRNFWIELTDCEWISPESDPQEFERLAIRNGDVGYNRWLEFWEYPSAFADNFQTMHITSNADWDEEHRRGHCWTISCGPNFGPTPIISVADTKQGAATMYRCSSRI